MHRWQSKRRTTRDLSSGSYGLLRRGDVRVWLWRGSLLCGLLYVGVSLAHAGPWTKRWGEVYAKVNQGVFFAGDFVDMQGNLQSGVSYFASTTSLYTEIGLPLGLQFGAYLPYVISRNAFGDGSWYMHGALGDMELSLQWSPPVRLPFPLAARFEAKVPLYDINRISRVEAGKAIWFPAVGDGQLDFTLWFSGGGNIPGLPLFAFAELGYRFRTEAFPGGAPTGSSRTLLDSLTFATQLGWTFWRNWIAMVAVRGVIPFGMDTYTRGLLVLGLQLYLPVYRGWAVEVSYDPVVWARNSARSFGVFALGVSFRR